MMTEILFLVNCPFQCASKTKMETHQALDIFLDVHKANKGHFLEKEKEVNTCHKLLLWASVWESPPAHAHRTKHIFVLQNKLNCAHRATLINQSCAQRQTNRTGATHTLTAVLMDWKRRAGQTLQATYNVCVRHLIVLVSQCERQSATKCK